MVLASSGFRRNSAPVNGAMYGTPASEATGSAASEVGVPTGPISPKTPSSWMSWRVFSSARSGW